MGPSIWQLLIVLVIVLLLFGTKRLRNLGADLGSAVKGFKSSVKDGEKGGDETPAQIENADAEQDGGEHTKSHAQSKEQSKV